MKRTLGMVFFLVVLAGTAGCGEKNTADITAQENNQTEQTDVRRTFFLGRTG